ncbi:MAG: hypothetical protein JWO84_216 [Parcubacteria group bacterium]|nr:hypothetical protein [Parcubacteria group bacterium]
MTSAHAFGSHMAHLRNSKHRSVHSWPGSLGAGVEPIPKIFAVCMIIPFPELGVDDLVFWLIAAALPSWTSHLEMRFKVASGQEPTNAKLEELLKQLHALEFSPTEIAANYYGGDYAELRISLFGAEELGNLRA